MVDHADTTTFQWLIERGQPEGCDPPVYLENSASHPAAHKQWTKNVHDAALFPNRDTATDYITEQGLEARAVEHGFMSAPPSDHADTIRRAIDSFVVHEGDTETYMDALAALDALLAERQQAQEEANRWRLHALETDANWLTLTEQLQQAIDALREIVALAAHSRHGATTFDDQRDPRGIARAALVKLGERP